MTRRTQELLLLCAAAPIVILMFVMLAITQGSELGIATFAVPVGIFAAFILAHVSIRFLAPGADPAILPIAFALSGIGIAFITRLAPELAGRQVLWFFVSVVCMIAVLFIVRNLDKLASYKYTLMLVGLILLLSPMVPFLGQEIYGSRIWISIGPASFQPGEVAKIAIVLFLASYLSQNREMLSVFTWRVGPLRLPDIRTLFPLLIMWGISMVIVIFEKDLGSALVFFLVFLSMLYIASGKNAYLVIALVLATIAAVVLYSAFSHVQVRVQTWLDPFEDPTGTGYQLVQALYSMADGGLIGVGIGRGLATLIPVVESDFIFAAIAEETGLLGGGAVLLLYLCFAIRGYVTASRARTDVSSLAAAGLTTTIVLQAFIIVGGVTKLIPLTGLTLPFVSQGGSSLLAGFISLALLLRIGDQATGIETEMRVVNSSAHSNSVLGRISLGKRLTRTMIVFSLLFAALVANLTYIMIIRADYYQNLPGNNHTLIHEQQSERGTISTYDGVVLARSVLTDSGIYVREYPSGDLASHVVGYASMQYGTSGIENAYNDVLKGEASFASWDDAIDSLSGSGSPGNDVTLTINSTIQRAAQEALEGRSGACIVLDPTTGATLALASGPTYNASEATDILENSTQGTGTADSSLFNRATQALYAPGSTFKIVTLAIALENDIASEDTMFDSPGSMDIGGAPVTNFDNIAYGAISLARATEVSSNTVFGQLGVEIGRELLVKGSEKFLLDTDVEYDLPLVTSLMPKANEMTTWETAWAAAGMPVGSHASPAGPQVTVLEMALVGCAVSNNGTIMTPYLVDSISNSNGEPSFTAQSTVLTQAMTSQTANRVKDVLRGVVEYGTGYAAMIDGADVYGKTGTAERDDGNENVWFVGTASVDGHSITIAIIIEDGESGEATEKAQNVLRTALEVQGLL